MRGFAAIALLTVAGCAGMSGQPDLLAFPAPLASIEVVRLYADGQVPTDVRIAGPLVLDPPITAYCRDGDYVSYSQTRRGTCSHHGGVRLPWVNKPAK